MVDFGLAAAGVGIGIAASAPIGPVNILCIQRSVRFGFREGFTSGCGALLADLFYASVAAFGISAVSDLIEGHAFLLKIVGGLLLIVFGGIIVMRTPHPERAPVAQKKLGTVGAAAAALFLSLTNPALLFGFLAMFSGLEDLQDSHHGVQAAMTVVSGVLVGGLCWWLCVSAFVSHHRTRITPHRLHLMNILSGLALTGFGAVIFADAVFERFF